MQNIQVGNENFDLWLKLANDNKINSRNSWDVALIDYFYDLSLLREGDKINFQKASATLDGCVKIYTSRIDSAVTETGKLLSGLSTKKGSENEPKGGDDNIDNDNSGGDDHDDNENQRRRVRQNQRSDDGTLVEFDKIRLKKLDSELIIDPLFRKALFDFDEGGSKSLLFSILRINEEVRVIFDASGPQTMLDLTEDESKIPDAVQSNNDDNTANSDILEIEEDQIDDNEIILTKDNGILNRATVPNQNQRPTNDADASFLRAVDENVQDLAKYFAFDEPNAISVCPSLPVVEDMLNDLSLSADSLFDRLDANVSPNLSSNYNNEIMEQEPGADAAAGSFFDFALDNDLGFDNGNEDIIENDIDNDDDDGIGKLSSIDETEEAIDSLFNIGSKTLRNLFNEKPLSVADILRPETVNGDENDAIKEKNEDQDEDFGGALLDVNLIEFFDKNLKKNWAGPEHWKVTNLKNRLVKDFQKPSTEQQNAEALIKKAQKKKEFSIDFLSTVDEDESVNKGFEKKYFVDVTETKNNARGFAHMLPKSQMISDTHNLLPFDRKYTTKKFITLFYKDDYINSPFLRHKKKAQKIAPDARNFDENANENFFNDDGDANGGFGRDEGPLDFDFGNENDGDDNNHVFDDIPDLGPPSEVNNYVPSSLVAPFGPSRSPTLSPRKFADGSSQGLYFARKANKVDIKLLKNNLWKSIKKRSKLLDSLEKENDDPFMDHDIKTEPSKKLAYNMSLAESVEHSEFSAIEHEMEKLEKLGKPEMKFSDIVKATSDRYDGRGSAESNISCSFYFICLLHLANEKKFTIRNQESLEDLTIIR